MIYKFIKILYPATVMAPCNSEFCNGTMVKLLKNVIFVDATIYIHIYVHMFVHMSMYYFLCKVSDYVFEKYLNLLKQTSLWIT